MNLNIKGKAAHTFDAIVVGSGISGGWAAKELTEKGMKTLVLERGHDVKHIVDYQTANSAPWELQWLNRPSREMLAQQSKQARTGYTVRPEAGYLMDHHLGVGARGTLDTHQDKIHFGRRPNGFYIPRFRNFNEKPNGNYLHGFGYQGAGMRQGWNRGIEGFGADFKKELTSFEPWSIGMGGFGECLPNENNRISLSKEKTDKWGLPLVVADAEFQENEFNMREDMLNDASEMLEALGAKNVGAYNSPPSIGLGIHEMGTARMGGSAKVSVLNKHNQVWGAENVFCTDGAAMTSASCQNPSLTYMALTALTARAADYAVSELKNGNL